MTILGVHNKRQDWSDPQWNLPKNWATHIKHPGGTEAKRSSGDQRDESARRVELDLDQETRHLSKC